MLRVRTWVLLLAMAAGLGACGGGSGFISPNDPDYARTGAPRAGEPPLTGGYYSRIQGSDGDRP